MHEPPIGEHKTVLSKWKRGRKRSTQQHHGKQKIHEEEEEEDEMTLHYSCILRIQCRNN